MGYKKIEDLMQHLRQNGIEISGEKEKRQLINTGYFHGYKGYRFFENSTKHLPFTSYKEIYATIQYDSELKSLLYDKMMFIETAIKNIALESILVKANSESIQDMYDKVVCSYNNSPKDATIDQKRKLQQNKLNLQNSVQSSLANTYKKGNPQITHFYNNIGYSDVPIWALFEIMTMGDLGYLLSCLTYNVRDDISKRLGLNLSCDTNRQLIYKYVYILKDLRNAIAHNHVVFDTRFRNIDPSGAMKQCLKLEIGLPYVNFKTIGDYIILMCYYMKILELPVEEIMHFIYKYEEANIKYKKTVSADISKTVIHSDTDKRMCIIKNYLKNDCITT